MDLVRTFDNVSAPPLSVGHTVTESLRLTKGPLSVGHAVTEQTAKDHSHYQSQTDKKERVFGQISYPHSSPCFKDETTANNPLGHLPLSLHNSIVRLTYRLWKPSITKTPNRNP